VAARTPTAIGQIVSGASLRTEAGARLTVTRLRGVEQPAFFTADWHSLAAFLHSGIRAAHNDHCQYGKSRASLNASHQSFRCYLRVINILPHVATLGYIGLFSIVGVQLPLLIVLLFGKFNQFF